MVETEKEPKTPSLKMAMQFKEFCRVLIKDKVNTRAEKERLAEELEITPGGVEGLIYHGRGSFENYIAALAFLYGFNLKDLKGFLLNFRDRLRRLKPIKNSDKIWFDLDRYYSEDHKEYLASVWRAAAKLNFRVTVKKVNDDL
jgi:hypothetical protein